MSLYQTKMAAASHVVYAGPRTIFNLIFNFPKKRSDDRLSPVKSILWRRAVKRQNMRQRRPISGFFFSRIFDKRKSEKKWHRRPSEPGCVFYDDVPWKEKTCINEERRGILSQLAPRHHRTYTHSYKPPLVIRGSETGKNRINFWINLNNFFILILISFNY